MKFTDETEPDPQPLPRTRLPEGGRMMPLPPPDTDEELPPRDEEQPETETPTIPPPTLPPGTQPTQTQPTTQTPSSQTPTTQAPPSAPPPPPTPASASQMGSAPPPPPESEFLQFLPTIYREDPFVGRFLMAFEEVFLDLESSVAAIADFFTPHATPKDFLPWLAKWTALSLRADLDENQQRDFIANVIRLYRWRGSKANLQRLLKIFTGGEAVVTEDADTPHYFYVALSLPKEWREKPVEFLGRKKEIAYDLIDLEKPAHTYYKLDFIYPSMQIGVRSTIGKDTVLGVGIRE
jgi:phage tail-like protein